MNFKFGDKIGMDGTTATATFIDKNTVRYDGNYPPFHLDIKKNGKKIDKSVWWDTCNNTRDLLYYVQRFLPKIDKKLRLLAIHCCHLDWNKIDPKMKRMVHEAEKFVDGKITKKQLASRFVDARTIANKIKSSSSDLASYCCRPKLNVWDFSKLIDSWMIKEVFGNPFSLVKPVTNNDVKGLAETIYNERSFELMPVLADALEDAGCQDSQILGHLRSDCHAKGCWVLDLLKGNNLL